MKVTNFWKWWTVFIVGVICFGVGWYRFDLVNEILARDITYMTLGMIVLAVCTSVSTFGKRWSHWHEFIAEMMTRLGFVGTIIGFMIALSSADLAGVESLDEMVNSVNKVLTGMGVAMTTTLAGLILQIWLDFQKRSIKDDQEA